MRDGLHSSFYIFENAVIKEVQISTHFVINVIVMNGPLKVLTACKILPLLDLLAKFKRVLGMLANARKDHSSPLCVKDRSNKRDLDLGN